MQRLLDVKPWEWWYFICFFSGATLAASLMYIITVIPCDERDMDCVYAFFGLPLIATLSAMLLGYSISRTRKRVYLAIVNADHELARKTQRYELKSEITKLEKSLAEATKKLKRLQPEDEEFKTDLLTLD